jgi:hypothetical protein
MEQLRELGAGDLLVMGAIRGGVQGELARRAGRSAVLPDYASAEGMEEEEAEALVRGKRLAAVLDVHFQLPTGRGFGRDSLQRPTETRTGEAVAAAVAEMELACSSVAAPSLLVHQYTTASPFAHPIPHNPAGEVLLDIRSIHWLYADDGGLRPARQSPPEFTELYRRIIVNPFVTPDSVQPPTPPQ